MQAATKTGSGIIKERHWHTQALVDVFIGMGTGEQLTWEQLGQRAGISAQSAKSRYESAKKIALREHHVVIDIAVRGVSIRRVAQQDVPGVADKGITRMRNTARSVRRTIVQGVTDFDALPSDVKSTLHMQSAVAGTVLLVTERSSKRTLKEHAETTNGELKLGRTLELLK